MRRVPLRPPRREDETPAPTPPAPLLGCSPPPPAALRPRRVAPPLIGWLLAAAPSPAGSQTGGAARPAMAASSIRCRRTTTMQVVARVSPASRPFPTHVHVARTPPTPVETASSRLRLPECDCGLERERVRAVHGRMHDEQSWMFSGAPAIHDCRRTNTKGLRGRGTSPASVLLELHQIVSSSSSVDFDAPNFAG